MTTRIHVGEYLQDELDARGWTTRDCAERMALDPTDGKEIDIWQLTLDLTLASVHWLDEPRTRMGKDTAEALGRAMGSSPEVWLNLDKAYRGEI